MIRKNWIKIKKLEREYNRKLKESLEPSKGSKRRKLSYKPGMALSEEYSPEVTSKLEKLFIKRAEETKS